MKEKLRDLIESWRKDAHEMAALAKEADWERQEELYHRCSLLNVVADELERILDEG